MNPGCINCQPKPQREQRYDTAHSLSSQSWAEKYRHRGHFAEHISTVIAGVRPTRWTAYFMAACGAERWWRTAWLRACAVNATSARAERDDHGPGEGAHRAAHRVHAKLRLSAAELDAHAGARGAQPAGGPVGP